MTDPLSIAKDRLHAALLRGHDTGVLRAEIAKLTEKQAVQDRKSAEAEAKQCREYEAGIANRSEALAEQVEAGIAALVAKHPLPSPTA